MGRSSALGYMSPEQLSGKPADQRSDIFAFGAVLFEMLAGTRAFGGDSRANVVAAILRDDPPAFAALNRPVPAPLEQLVRRCLEKRPRNRYQSVHDLALACARSRTPPTGRPPARRGLDPASARVVAVVVAVVAVAALAVWGWRWVGRRVVEQTDVNQMPVAPSHLANSAPRHLAVLPFAAVGGEDGDAALAAGWAECSPRSSRCSRSNSGPAVGGPVRLDPLARQVRRDYNVTLPSRQALVRGGTSASSSRRSRYPGDGLESSDRWRSSMSGGAPARVVEKAADLWQVRSSPGRTRGSERAVHSG